MVRIKPVAALICPSRHYGIIPRGTESLADVDIYPAKFVFLLKRKDMTYAH
jgi:hypothetical protein